MARIRTVKPEFWQDEKLSTLEPITRLVFLGLISMADDAGRLVDNIKTIDGFIFPETADSSREPIESLARLSRVLRYTSDSGQRLLQVVNWERHQKVDNPNKYTLPAPSREVLARVSRDPSVTTNDLRPTTNDQGPTINNDDSARAKDPIIGSVRHLALSNAMTSTDYRSALEGFLRAAHDPYRLLSELEAVVSGASGPGGRPVTPDVIGRAMHDMLVANVTQMTTRRLAAFIRGVLEPPPPRQRQPADDDEGEFVRAGRKLEAEDAARRQGAVRHA